MREDRAEAIALQALAWIAEDDSLLPAFLDATGIGPGALAQAAAEPEVLGAVLDFLLSRDGWILAFARRAELPPEAVNEARRALPGGDHVHWT